MFEQPGQTKDKVEKDFTKDCGNRILPLEIARGGQIEMSKKQLQFYSCSVGNLRCFSDRQDYTNDGIAP